MTRFFFYLIWFTLNPKQLQCVADSFLFIRLQRPITSFKSPKTIVIKHVVSVAYLFSQHENEAYWRDHYKKLRDRFGFSSSLKKTLVVGTNLTVILKS